jgi:anaerobic ribonucleoside-triphosphate reductase
MEQRDYYGDLKFCANCQKYVSYLMSTDHSYCIECGERVKLFSKEDWVQFHENLNRAKPKGGRPRKHRGRESA